MSELRYNIMSKDWVIIASERAKRPHDFKKAKPAAAQPSVEKKADCPFCPGNEAASGPDVARIGNAKSWKVRTVQNKFPALSRETKPGRAVAGPYKKINGFGTHEVIVEHPRHDMRIPLMKDGEVEDIIRMYRQRYIDISKIEGIKSITIFKNNGPAAGCSLEHPHSQLVAALIVPPNIRSRVESAEEYYDVTGKCLLCETLEHETNDKARIVLETKDFVAFVPYASFMPFIVWIAPRRHTASFCSITDEEVKDLAQALGATLGKLYAGLGDPDYNYTIRSAPVKEKWNEALHWYLNIIPRISQPAGFELGSGMFINTSIPEECAEFLRLTTPV